MHVASRESNKMLIKCSTRWALKMVVTWRTLWVCVCLGVIESAVSSWCGETKLWWRLTFRSRASPEDRVACRGRRAHDDRRFHRCPRHPGADACGTSGAMSVGRVWRVHGRANGVYDGRMYAESALDGVQMEPADDNVRHRQSACPRQSGADNGCCKTGGL